VGQFRNFKFFGQGKLTYKSGTVREGQFENGMLNGHGTLQQADGLTYVGQFKDNHLHGQGRCVHGSTVCEGLFENDKLVLPANAPSSRTHTRTSNQLNAPLLASHGPTLDAPAPEAMERNYRATLEIKIGANCVASCCYLNSCCDELQYGDLEPYNLSEWGGRISADDYAQFGAELKTAYQGTFLTDICVNTCFCCFLCWCCAVGERCCSRDAEVNKVIDKYNKDLLAKRRGVQLGYGPRLRVNGESAAHKIVAVIRPIS